MITLTPQQLEAIRSACREYKVTKLELFGSATRADFDPARSDIDVLVEFAPGTDLGPWMARFFEFQGQLEGVLGRKVDLVMVAAVRNPYLMRAINQDRHMLYSVLDAEEVERSLQAWHEVYAGLSPDEVAAVEQIVLDRGHFMHGHGR
jgi:predicted nucleotidyltransferase